MIRNAKRPPILDDLEKLRDMLTQQAARMVQHLDHMQERESHQHFLVQMEKAADTVSQAAIRFAADWDAKHTQKAPQ